MDTLPFTENASVIAFMMSIYTALFCGGIAVNLRLWQWQKEAPIDWSMCAARLIARARPARNTLFIVTAWFLLTITGPLAAQRWWGATAATDPVATRWYLTFNILAQALVVLMVLNASLRGSSAANAFGFGRALLRRHVVLGALGYLAMMPFFFASSVLWAGVMSLFGIPMEPQSSVELFVTLSSTWTRITFLILAVAGAPLCEEFVFRGLALPLAARHFGLWPAALAVSAVFAVIHAHAPTLAPLFCLGFAFALSYIVTGSLAVPMVMHAIFNSVNLVCLLAGDWLS